jgi:hypothetical protein
MLEQSFLVCMITMFNASFKEKHKLMEVAFTFMLLLVFDV